MTNTIYNLEIFSWIEHSVIDSILTNCEEASFSSWNIIIQQWDASDWKWYIIKTGSVKVSIEQKIIATLHEWSMIWEIWLLNEEERGATVEALEECTVTVLTIDDLIEMINNDENKINKEIIRRIEENLGNS